MPITRLWGLRIAAIAGCLVLFIASIACSVLLITRSWHDLDDATVRMRVFRNHGFYNWDYIWSVIAFGMIVVSVVALIAFCLWMFWILASHWDMSGRKNGTQG